ncbi:MAG: XRE family transcriptional regulator [Lysobacterales bacterium 63-13]|nr:MAG: XRE family transcriptional regulator [Xanthomonadales bacterium 63-13]
MRLTLPPAIARADRNVAGARTPMISNQPTIGSLLRALRARNDWTLKEMSGRCAIPLSTLSKIEHDRLTLTYDKLLQISQRLGLRMSELFAETAAGDEHPITARRSIGRIKDSIRVNTPNYDYYYLCPELRRKHMTPVMTRVRARSLAEFGDLVRHSGEEYIHILEGAAEVHTEFYEPVVLNVGESVYIDSNMGHAYTVAAGHDEALLLGICTCADEQLLGALLNLPEDPATEHSIARPRLPAAEATRATPIDKRRGNRTQAGQTKTTGKRGK